MGVLNNYQVRQQARRLISVDAKSKNAAKDEAERDVWEMGDTDRAIAVGNPVLLEENVGVDTDPAQSTLNRYEVEVIIRRNISMEAEGKNEARQYSKDDQNGWNDTIPNSIVTQRIRLIRSNTGVT